MKYSAAIDASENHGRSDTLLPVERGKTILLLEGPQASLTHQSNKNSVKLKMLGNLKIAVCNNGSGILIFF